MDIFINLNSSKIMGIFLKINWIPERSTKSSDVCIVANDAELHGDSLGEMRLVEGPHGALLLDPVHEAVTSKVKADKINETFCQASHI